VAIYFWLVKSKLNWLFQHEYKILSRTNFAALCGLKKFFYSPCVFCAPRLGKIEDRLDTKLKMIDQNLGTKGRKTTSVIFFVMIQIKSLIKISRQKRLKGKV